VKVGDRVTVKVIAIDDQNRIKLSRRRCCRRARAATRAAATGRRGRTAAATAGETGAAAGAAATGAGTAARDASTGTEPGAEPSRNRGAGPRGFFVLSLPPPGGGTGERSEPG